MATLIGVVSQVVGEVFAVAGDGMRRPLVEGDRVFAGEQLVTGAGGAVAIALAGGGELTLGRDSSLMLDTQVLAGMRGDGAAAPESAGQTAPSDKDLTDVEQLQAAIEAGVDPTVALAATAAGPGSGGAGGGGGHSFVLLGETAGALEPVIGFPTEGLGFVPEFPDPDIEQTNEQAAEEPVIPQIILGERQSVSESALATGSNADSDGEFASGTFQLAHAGGLSVLQSLTINDVTVSIVSLVGVSFVGEHGILTITGYDGSTGVVSYSYELTSPANSSTGNPSGIFTLSASDGTQSSTPANLVIEIFDDVPNAVDDSHSIAEDTLAPISGNVLSNDLHANGQPGADAPNSFVSWSSTAAAFGSFSDTGNGTYSYLLDNSNPAVQALDEGESLSETFSYTMQDADGDLDTATLTITITGSDDGPQLNVDPGNQGGNDQVFEAGLASGSNAGASSIVATGTFTLSDADGLDDLVSVTIGTTTVAIANLAGSTFAGTNGTLTVTAYNTATGVASYSYELTSPTSDGVGVETDSFSLSVSDGTTSSAPASIIIEIVDDVPNAVDDSHSIAEDTLAPISGNVLSNDLHANGQPGADVPTSFVSWSSTAAAFGSFSDTGNGTYSYLLDNSNPAVQALDSGQSLTETFSYTMQDADGDLDTATLTITINGSNDGPQLNIDPGNQGGNDQVFEAGLANGSAAAGNGEFATGTFTLSDADGLDDLVSVTIGTTTVAIANLAGSTFAGTNGTLTVTAYNAATGVASYSYELTSPTSDGLGTETDSFSLSVSDGTTSLAPASIIIEIVDDVPNAVDDSHSIAEDTLAPISGNVLSNDLHANGQPGADTPTSFVGWASTAASYGIFSDTGNGTYSYLLDNSNPAVQALDSGQTLTETFSYTMQDADGDLDTATLTITINGSNDGPQLNIDPGNQGGNDQVFEAGLASGSNAGVSSIVATGTFSLSDADGLDDLVSVTIGTTTVAIANLAGSTFAGTNGTLTVTAYNTATGVASYSYELTSPTSDGVGVETDSFSLSVSDGTTSSAPASIIIEIVDDLPNAVDDSHSIAEDTLAPIGGNVLSNDLHANGQPGADAPNSFVSWSSTAAAFGSFSDTGNGTYSYLLDNRNPAVQALDSGQSLTETFSYTMQDADGDLDTATLTITINGSNDGPQLNVDPGNQGGNDQVFEAGLANGSAAAGNGEFATGTFTLSDADGLDDLVSVTIGTTTVAIANLAGSTFAGTNGTLTVTAYNAATGVASYSYELTSPTTDGLGTETDSFSLSVSDGTTSSAPASIIIEILDDVPNAVDDSHSIAEDTLAPISGNVLSNDLHANGQPGADVPTSFVSWSSTAAAFGSFSDTGNGTYSYLLDNSNPAVQALDEGESLSETFSYTMQDADGDLDTATLTITITGSDDGPQLNVDPGNQGGNDQVFEAGLANGSAAAGNGEFATGTFTLSDADGLDDLVSVTIDTTTVAIANLAGSTFAGTNGTLTVTAYNAATGVASYSYELTSPTSDGPGVETDSFSLSVSDGTTSSAPASIIIEIVDDVPNAVDDSHSIAEDTLAPISGNVLSNDLHANGQPGADTPTSFVGWASTAASYGTFSDTGNGTYSYLLDNSNPAVQALDEGESLSETFSYTMQDADGDLDTATLTITITGSDDGPQLNVDPGNQGGNDQVFEAGLANGSAAAGNGEFATGTFTLSDADGLDDLVSVTIDTTTVAIANLAGSTFAGTNGTLTVTAYNAATGVASYSYELTSPTNDGPGVETDSFSLSVSDGTTSSAPASIIIEIVDDVPSAVDDSNLMFASENQLTLLGNVLNNDVQGADRLPGGPIQPGVLQGTYGTLTLSADGSYSYQLSPSDPDFLALGGGGMATETFTYTLNDADGDNDTANLVLQVRNLDDKVQIKYLDVRGGEQSVDEDDLLAGSDPSKEFTTVSGTFKVQAPDGLLNLTVGGINVVVNGVVNGFPQSITTPQGNILTITDFDVDSDILDEGIVSYSYTLSGSAMHSPGAGENQLTEHFAVLAEDVDHDTDLASLDINIVDDVPNAVDDSHSIAEDTVMPISGNVLSNDLHANGQPGADVPTSFVGWASTAASYGTFSDTGNGTYSYLLDNSNPTVQALDSGQSLTETFSYTMQDADGDLDTATLTITILGADDSAQVVTAALQGPDETVYEKGLTSAADTSETTGGTFTVSATDSIASVTVGGVSLSLAQLQTLAANNQVINTGEGLLTLTNYSGSASAGTLSYSYTLSAAIDNDSHSGATGTHFDDSVTVSVLGVGGSTASDELVIRIVDDTPTAVSDGPVGVTEDGASFVSGNVLTNDSAGADAPKEFTAWSAEGQDNSAALTALGSYGVLTLGSDGVYSFTLDNSQAAVQALTSGSNLSYDLYYTMRDADGDPSSAKLTITITGADDNASVVTAAAAGPDATVYEHGLTSVGDTSETVTGSFTVTASDGIASVSVGGSTFSLAQLLALSTTNQVVNTGEGNLTLTGYNAATGVVSYSYTLSATIDNDSHTDATGSHFDDSVTVSVLGVGGSTASDELVIRIVDDTPTAVNDGPVGVTEDGASFVSGNVLTNDSAGADAPKEFTAWSAEGQDNSAALTALGSYGVLTLGSDGVYSFTLDNSQAAVQALTSGSNLSYDLYYTMRDADGDPSSAKLTITITGADDNASVVTAAAEGPDATVYEHGLTSAGDTSETVTGSFTVTASDGIASVTVGGSTFSLAQLQALSTANQVVNTGEGNLTLTGYNAATGVVSYSYTLSATIDNDSHSGATGTHFDDSVTVSVLGVGGSTASDELVIRIVDDTPTLTTVSPASLTNGPSGYATGSSDPVIGADVPGSADLTGNIAGWNGTSVTYAASSLTSGGNTVYYSVNPDDMGVLYAFTSATPAPYSGGAGQSLIFTLTYDVAGNYVIDMNGKLDGPAQTFGAIFNQNIGGNQDYLLVTDTGMLYKPSDSIPAGQTVIMSVDSSVGTVNSSQQGLAADSQWISGGLVLYFSYASPVVSAQFSIDIQSSDTTNAVNWTVYGQDALGNSVTESGTTVFTEGVLTDIPTTLTGITRIDLSDTGGSGFRVSGSSIVDRIEEDPISTSFDIGVIDADGDPASATLDVVFQPQFAGQFVVGSNANDVAGSAALYVTPAGAGGITGKGGNDILVGDEGRSDLVGKNVNMILALDSSDSMTTNISFNGTTMSRMAALKLAVNGLLSGLAVSAADNVRIQLVDFNNSAQSLGVFDIKGGELIAAQNAVNGLSANGWTNYEAGLQVALNWVASVGADAPYTGANVINQVVFVSDGAPNSWLSGNSTNLNNTVTNGATSTAVAHVLGTHNSDAISEVALLEAAFGQIQAVGINVGGSALDILNQIEGELSSVNPDVASNITTGEQLASVLADFNPETQLYDAGNDSILGGAGDDLIFGDVLYTDVLAAAAGLSTNPGAGWQVFAALESGVGTGAYATWTRADTVDYVLTHADELGQESGRALGHDSIDAGAGNDLVYGQEGNDIISGGSGDDVLFGGSGNDTLLGGDGDDLLIGGLGADVMTGGAGQDSYIWQPENLGDGVDHITGFFIDTSGIGSDVLDLSQLLTGVDTSVGSLQSYLDFAFAGTTTTVSVNVDASGPVEQQLVLDNINLSIFYGTANEASIITNLLDDSALKVDTV